MDNKNNAKQIFFMANATFVKENKQGIITVSREDGITHFPWKAVYSEESQRESIQNGGPYVSPGNLILTCIREITLEEYNEAIRTPEIIVTSGKQIIGSVKIT